MNENEVVNEVVETMTKVDPEQLAQANEQLLNKAIETTLANQPAPQPKPGLSTGVKVGIGVLGGTAIGIALDHWVFPKISNALENAKNKRAQKKAEKAAKKAAKAAGEKAIAMIKQKELLPLTGYVHGGCSPIGMKKPFPTYIHESALLYDFIYISAGQRGLQFKIAPQDLFDFVGAEIYPI